MNQNYIHLMLQLTADIAELLLATKDDGQSEIPAELKIKISELHYLSQRPPVVDEGEQSEILEVSKVNFDSAEPSENPEVNESTDVDDSTYIAEIAENAETEEVEDALPDGPSVHDIRHSFSLNDTFLFRRTLFHGSVEEMKDALEHISRCSSYDELRALLHNHYGFNLSQPEPKAFLAALEPFFL